jgi:hypothetical protein
MTEVQPRAFSAQRFDRDSRDSTCSGVRVLVSFALVATKAAAEPHALQSAAALSENPQAGAASKLHFQRYAVRM